MIKEIIDSIKKAFQNETQVMEIVEVVKEIPIKSKSFSDMLLYGPSSTSVKKFNNKKEELESYTALPFVAASIDAISRDAGSQPWAFKNKAGEEVDLKRIDSKITIPLETGYAGENFSNMIKKNIIPHLLLSGNAYLWKKSMTLDGQVKRYADTLVPIRPDRVEIVLDTTGLFLIHYVIMFDDGVREIVSPEDMIHFKQNTVFSPFIGVGNITKMRLLAEGEFAAEAFQNEFLLNKATANLVIEDPREISEEDAMINRKYTVKMTSGIKNAGVPLYLHSGAKAKSITTSQKDMQFLESKEYNRQAIISLFGLTPIILGIPDDANKAIASTMRIGYLRDTINNLLNELSLTITHQFVKPINTEIVFSFSLYDVGDIENLQIALTMGIASPNECRLKLGLAKVEDNVGMDEYYGNMSQMPYRYLVDSMVVGNEETVEKVGKSIKPEGSKGTETLKQRSLDVIYSKYVKSLGSCSIKSIYTSGLNHSIKNYNSLLETEINAEISNPKISKLIQEMDDVKIKTESELKEVIEEAYDIGTKIAMDRDVKARTITRPKASKNMVRFHRYLNKSRPKFEKQFSDEVKEIYIDMSKRILSKLGKSSDIDTKAIDLGDIMDMLEEENIAREKVKKIFASIVGTSARKFDNFLASNIEDSVKIPLVVEKLSKKYVSQTLNTNKEELRALLKASHVSGDDIVTLKEKIKDYFNEYTQTGQDWKATRIARTEISNVYDNVAKLSYEDLGVKYCQVIGCTELENGTNCDSDGSRGTYKIEDMDGLVFHPNHIGTVVPVLEDEN